MFSGNDIDMQMLLRNNTPIKEFLGLTPNEMHVMLNDALGEESPLQLQDNLTDQTLDKIPLFRLAELYLNIIARDTYIKLTATGALPKKVLAELYEHRIILDRYVEMGFSKLHREINFLPAANIRAIVQFAGLTKKVKGKVYLTKTAEKLLAEKNRGKVFKSFFQSYTSKFAWSYNDSYTDAPVAQYGWAFSVLLLMKFGDTQNTIDFYAEKFLLAFPTSILFFHDGFGTPKSYYIHCYGLRTFELFFTWLGFVSIVGEKQVFHRDNHQYLKTEVVSELFKIVD